MRMRAIRIITSATVAFLCLLSSAIAAESRYPLRPVRVIVPAPPGGTVDLVARTLSPHLAEQMTQQFVVDNRAGAGGVIAAELLAGATPDGYTIGALYTSFTINAALRKKSSYDPVNGIAPISMVSVSPLVLSVFPGLGVGNVRELVAAAKTRKLLYGTAGNGTGAHMLGELFKITAGIDAVHVPYKGAAPAIAAMVAGEVQYQFAGPIAVLSLAKSGRLRNIAVTSLKRNASMPELPTMDESGFPGFEVINWFGIAAPAKTPADIITRLNAEIQKTLRTDDVAQKLGGQGSDITGGTPGFLGDLIRRDVEKWTRVVQKAGIGID